MWLWKLHGYIHYIIILLSEKARQIAWVICCGFIMGAPCEWHDVCVYKSGTLQESEFMPDGSNETLMRGLFGEVWLFKRWRVSKRTNSWKVQREEVEAVQGWGQGGVPFKGAMKESSRLSPTFWSMQNPVEHFSCSSNCSSIHFYS